MLTRRVLLKRCVNIGVGSLVSGLLLGESDPAFAVPGVELLKGRYSFFIASATAGLIEGTLTIKKNKPVRNAPGVRKISGRATSSPGNASGWLKLTPEGELLRIQRLVRRKAVVDEVDGLAAIEPDGESAEGTYTFVRTRKGEVVISDTGTFFVTKGTR